MSNIILSDTTVRFFDEDHTYRCNGEVYTSVTTLLSRLKPKIDWYEKAKLYVSKRTDYQILEDLSSKWGLTTEEMTRKFGDTFTPELVRDIWKQSGVRATRGGTNYHNWKELEDSKNEGCVMVPLTNGVKDSLDLKTLEPDRTYLELLLYNHKARVAGQSDKVEIYADKSFKIKDYKVVNKLLTPDVQAYYNPETRRKEVKKYASPLNSIPVSPYWDYAAQLSTYAYMLERYGFTCSGLVIIQVKTKWIREEELGTEFVVDIDEQINKVRIVTDVKEVEVPYVKDSVKNLF